MKKFKKIICFLMIAALSVSVIMGSTISSAASGSGVGLAEWAMRAYNEGWSYVWGGDTVGAVDCSGMITSYCGGNRTSMLADAQEHGRDWGYVSDGIPNIHGLGLSRPNHVGVYVGNGMEVDARGDDYDVCYQAVGSRWDCWFKLTAVTYPTTGWEKFNGSYYYYENGEYLADTSRNIDGTTYYFASSGVSSSSPISTAPKATTDAGSATKEKQPAEDNAPLKKGSQGARVEKLQARLQELGYYDGAVDGDFGEKTEQAFKRFQKQAGLYEDGIAGYDAEALYADDAPAYVAERPTLSKNEIASTGLNLSTSLLVDEASDDGSDDNGSDGGTPSADEQAAAPEDAEAVRLANGDSGDDVAAVQERLIQLGYLDGDADGAFGSMTEAAVKEFQIANRLSDSGVVDQSSYDALFSNEAVKSSLSADTAAQPAHPAAVVAATTAKDTAIERDTVALSQSSFAAISEDVGSRKADSTNPEFLVWLGIMIVVMSIAFAVIYHAEKKRARAMAHAGRRFQ